MINFKNCDYIIPIKFIIFADKTILIILLIFKFKILNK